jgi:hypothetical protein
MSHAAVTATPGDGTAQGARAGGDGAPAHWEDLASFVRFLEQRGQLKRITREVDANLEISAIAQQVMRAGGPALLFERVVGSRFPLLINTYATRQRVSWSLGVADLDEHARAILDLVRSQPPTGLMDKLRMLPKLARVASATPKTVRTAPCQQVIESDVDLGALPILTTWPGDGDHARSRQGNAQRRLLPDAGLRQAHDRHALAAAQDGAAAHAPLQGAWPAADARRRRAGRRSRAALRGDRAVTRRHR